MIQFTSETLVNLRAATNLQNSAESSGTYDLLINTDSSEILPDGLKDRTEILCREKYLFTDPDEPSISFSDGLNSRSVELIEGELPDQENEVSVGLNTALVHDWHPGRVLSAQDTPAGRELTITGIHNDYSVFRDLLVYQENLSSIPAGQSESVFYLRALDLNLIREIQQHPDEYFTVQISAYGRQRAHLPDQFSSYLQTITAVCLTASLLLIILSASSFLRIIQSEMDVLIRIGKKRKSILWDQFVMIFLIPVLICLVSAGILTVVEMAIWKEMHISFWLQEADLTLLSFFLKLSGLVLGILLLSTFILAFISIFTTRRSVIKKKKAGNSKKKKHHMPFQIRKLFLTGYDWMMILFLCLLTLSIPFVTIQSAEILNHEEHPLIALRDRDMSITMYFENASAEELQAVFNRAAEWSAAAGRTGYLELVGAAPLKNLLNKDNDPGTGNDILNSNLIVPLNSSVYQDLTADLNLPAQTEVVFLCTKQEQPLNVLYLSKSADEYNAAIQVSLESDKVFTDRNSNYSMVLMNPAAFRPEALSSSFSMVSLTISWYLNESTSAAKGIQEAQDLVTDWKPSNSSIVFMKEIRATQNRYNTRIFVITVVCLLLIGIILLSGILLLFRQKTAGLQNQIRCALNTGLSCRRIRREIRRVQMEQLLLAMIPSVLISLFLLTRDQSIVWLISSLLTAILCAVVLFCISIGLPD